MILGPLFDLKFLNERAGNHCRNFKSAALARLWAASAQGVARLTRWRTIWGSYNGTRCRLARLLCAGANEDCD